MEASVSPNVNWGEWRQRLGRQVRRVREFVGLSQGQLAELAHVSQAAVSRLEAGRGLATPLLLLMKVYVPLARVLRGLDPAMLSDDLRWILEFDEHLNLAPQDGNARVASPVTSDPGLEEIIRLYQRIPERRRGSLLVVARVLSSVNGD